MVCPAGTLFLFVLAGIAHAAPELLPLLVEAAVFVDAAVFGPQPQSGGSIKYKNLPFMERFKGYTLRSNPGNVVEIPPNNCKHLTGALGVDSGGVNALCF